MLKFKIYYDKDAEEDWLNEMSNRGWVFKKYFLGFYTFEKGEPGEYHYQIDLLHNWNGDKSDFASFMEETGVKVIAQWYRWVYLQKKASEGPFEMYTDLESKIAQYNRIRNFFRVGLILEFLCFLLELYVAAFEGDIFNWVITAFIGFLALIFLRMVWKCKWKIEQLEHEGR